MEACPPRLKTPTRYPVRPRLRVGIAFSVSGLEGSGGSTVVLDSATLPATTATPSTLDFIRKLRREELGVSVKKPPESSCYACPENSRNIPPRLSEVAN